MTLNQLIQKHGVQAAFYAIITLLVLMFLIQYAIEFSIMSLEQAQSSFINGVQIIYKVVAVLVIALCVFFIPFFCWVFIFEWRNKK